MSTSTENTNNNVNVDMTGQKEITIGGIVYLLNVTGKVSLTPKGGDTPNPPDPTKPPVVKPDTFGTIKDGAAWSKNPGPADTWKIVSMKDNPKLFKIIATDGKNVIADLESEAQAKALIEYFKTNVFPPKGNDNSNPTDPDGPAEPQPTPTTGDATPVKIQGNPSAVTQRGPTTRNYASGKPSDNTIEKNAKGLGYANVVAAFDIDVPAEWEHDDTLNIKIGGSHMGTGWFSHTISIYEGKTGLGKEEDHPSTDSNVVKGKVYGDLRGKRVGVGATYISQSNTTAFFVKLPGANWDKAAEAANVGGFNPEAKPDEQEVQLRIDGFKEMDKPPKIHSATIAQMA